MECVSDSLAFIRPLAPSSAVSPPKSKDWLREPKWDGFRFQVIKNGKTVRLYTRNGADYTERLPRMREIICASHSTPDHAIGANFDVHF